MPVSLNRAVSGGVDLTGYVKQSDLENPTPSIVQSLKAGLGVQDAGAAADRSLAFTAPAALAVWNIDHFLGKYPSVVVIDSAGDEVEGEVEYVNSNTLRITFSAAIGGKAYLN